MTPIRTEIHTPFTLPAVLKHAHRDGRRIKVTVPMVDHELKRAPMLILRLPHTIAEITPRGGEYLINLYKP